MNTPANHLDSSQSTDVRIVEISKEPVELYKILKFEGMVENGGQGKAVVAAGEVLVNGLVETQKRKKIVSGDTIEFNHEKISIELVSALTPAPSSSETEDDPDLSNDMIEETSDDSVAIGVEIK